ncbi:MAG: DUF362 domain-containing protein [Prolixibacteraceae bacterium]|nr:DUF362 domain-containing protein [Prolixibacteraceae bacterium]
MKFDITKFKGKLAQLRDWMTRKNLPPRLVFIILGVSSTIWFLIRVIPKPIRATYPCMQVAAPFMSGLVTYLLAVGGLTVLSRKLKRKVINVRFGATVMLMTGFILAMAIIPSGTTDPVFQVEEQEEGPIDGPNEPIGEAKGIFPGRVVWVWNPDATNENFERNSLEDYNFFWQEKNNNPEVISKMFADGILKLTGEKNISKSWDAIFKNFNQKKHSENRGYSKGETIFIKLNQGQANWVVSRGDWENGVEDGYRLSRLNPEGDKRDPRSMTPTENGPYVVLELLRQLVNEAGVKQEDIYLGDPMNPIYYHNYVVWSKEFPDVKYIDRNTDKYGRTKIEFTEEDLIFYSDKKANEKLYNFSRDADYMILLPVLKPHGASGISLAAKLNFGNIGSRGAGHLHYSHIANRREGIPTNTGYGKYRVFVDLMGSKYLGQNTLIWIVEGLFGGGSNEIMGPVKYFMPPFNNDWSNSIFLSLDPVAIESVGYDFLRAEFNGLNAHDSINNQWENIPNMFGVDDYLHQSADRANWPEGIIYDPDNSGNPLPSLGTHEHWNNPEEKLYSRNLGTGNGIELVTVPESLLKNTSQN